MSKQDKLALIHNKLIKLGYFLRRFLSIANAHNSYFIVENVWAEYLPTHIGEVLLQLPSEILAKLPNGALLTDTENHDDDLMNVDKLYDELGSDNAYVIREEQLKQENGHSVFEFCPVKENNTISTWDESLKPDWSAIKSLSSFLDIAYLHSIAGMKIISDCDKVISCLQDFGFNETAQESCKKSNIHVDGFMNVKKAHEIHKMADFCASVATNSKLNQVIEIGCGKAYLASQLALLHGLTVIGVEANSSHANSAQQRIVKFSQQLPGLVRNAKEDLQAGKKFKRGKHYRSKQRRKAEQQSNSNMNEVVADKEQRSRMQNSQCEENSVLGDSLGRLFLTSNDPSDVNYDELILQDIEWQDNNVGGVILDPSSQAAIVQSAVAMDVDVNNKKPPKKNHKNQHDNSKSLDTNISLVTTRVTTDTKLDDILSRAKLIHDDNASMCKLRTMLVGLHTCGSLACNILRMFAQSKSAGAVCVVGCCYQWMEEEFLQSPYYGVGEQPNPGFEMDVGFPMSDFLRKRHAQIGRNARLLTASLPMANNRLPEKSMFWRALLQVILTDMTGLQHHNWVVGKVAPSCVSFVDYVHKALTRLNLPLLAVEEIEAYYEKYKSFEAKVIAFFQLRGVVARSVETLILLDRLAYVLEQDSVADAHIVQLFDPVVSPRCYGIVAWKRPSDYESVVE